LAGNETLRRKEMLSEMKSYSFAKLSYERDKLIAISGLTQLLQSISGGQYIGCMWRKNLERQLCWHVYTPGNDISPYVTPSWPWAAFSGHGML
jgi:hypothetical protein